MYKTDRRLRIIGIAYMRHRSRELLLAGVREVALGQLEPIATTGPVNAAFGVWMRRPTRWLAERWPESQVVLGQQYASRYTA